jgi:hypothetical protein
VRLGCHLRRREAPENKSQAKQAVFRRHPFRLTTTETITDSWAALQVGRRRSISYLSLHVLRLVVERDWMHGEFEMRLATVVKRELPHESSASGL